MERLLIIGKKAMAKMTLVDKPWLTEEDLETVYGDGDDPSASHVDDPGSTSGKIHYPSGNKWTTVVDSANHTLAVVEVSHTDTAIKWECLVRTGDTVRLERFTISSPLP